MSFGFETVVNNCLQATEETRKTRGKQATEQQVQLICFALNVFIFSPNCVCLSVVFMNYLSYLQDL